MRETQTQKNSFLHLNRNANNSSEPVTSRKGPAGLLAQRRLKGTSRQSVMKVRRRTRGPAEGEADGRGRKGVLRGQEGSPGLKKRDSVG